MRYESKKSLSGEEVFGGVMYPRAVLIEALYKMIWEFEDLSLRLEGEDHTHDLHLTITAEFRKPESSVETQLRIAEMEAEAWPEWMREEARERFGGNTPPNDQLYLFAEMIHGATCCVPRSDGSTVPCWKDLPRQDKVIAVKALDTNPKKRK